MLPMMHYYLAAGTVTFVDTEGNTGQHTLNALVTREEMGIRLHDMGRIQQGLQINLFNKLKDDKIKILDIVISSISYLGHMTSDDFETAPAPEVLGTI